MAIYLENSVLIHIPKTGGVWAARTALDCVKHSHVGQNHNPVTAHHTPDIGDKTAVLFVRHPATWLRSLWQHRKYKKWNWDFSNRLEKKCWNKSFPEFINNVSNYPGIVKEYFDKYTSPYQDKCLIGKQEYLSQYLLVFLVRCGEKFREEKFFDMSKRKTNVARGINVDITPGMMESLHASQTDFYDTYKYGLRP